MEREVYGLITFKTTHQSMAMEKILKDREKIFKTIPTPREVSKSCGLSILFVYEELDEIMKIVEGEDAQIDRVYKFIKDGFKTRVEIIE